MHPISITQIFKESLDWVQKNTDIVVGVALAIHAFPGILIYYATGLQNPANLNLSNIIVLIIGAALTTILGQAMIFARMYLDLFGPHETGKGPWSLTFENFIPLLLLSIVTGVLTVLGFLALVIPGIFLTILWSVAAPALVVEHLTLNQALNRSADLTKGFRWQVLGLLLILVALLLVISSFWEAIANVFAGGDVENAGIWYIIISQIISGFFGVFFAVMQMNLFKTLRQKHSGLDNNEMTIFD
jgi:hypothetical protein